MRRPGQVLSDAERLDRLRLIRTDGVGPVAFRQMIARFGSAAAALDALPELARRGGRSGLRPCPAADAERELAALDRLGARLVAEGEPDYPPLLAAIDDAPPLFALRGDARLLARRPVAVVGARNASTNGRRLADRLATELGAAGLSVVSGLARGIDAAAHEAALPTGTVAVLAGGIDVVYPPEHDRLCQRIADSGAVIAECAVGTQPQARHFPRRNRIVSGLSLGVVVVEAALRSGSLITARLAAEQGREVFAVPGFPLDPRAQGCNRLIRGGATLVESAADILDGLPAFTPAPLRDPPAAIGGAAGPGPAGGSAPDDPDAVRDAVLRCLAPAPTQVDELLRDCQFSAAAVLTVLLELELAGRIERQPGNRVALL